MSEMLNVNIITLSGEEVKIKSELGLSLMEAIKAAGIDELVAICGGGCACATCHVYVDENFQTLFPAPEEDEVELLEALDTTQVNSRLSCQLELVEGVDGLTVRIAPED